MDRIEEGLAIGIEQVARPGLPEQLDRPLSNSGPSAGKIRSPFARRLAGVS